MPVPYVTETAGIVLYTRVRGLLSACKTDKESDLHASKKIPVFVREHISNEKNYTKAKEI